MSEITVVTGPMRSGTSGVTGLLERCGFDLGRAVRVLREPTADNPRGDLEPDLLLAINARLLAEANVGDPHAIPDPATLLQFAPQRERYFRYFIEKFDGDLIKDPMLCLTLPLWETRWHALQRVVFCVRHPLEVARSTEKRYDVTRERGLELWRIFTERFFETPTRCRRFVFDFNAFRRAPRETFSVLLDWLGRAQSADEIDQHLAEIFGAQFVHWSFGETDLREVDDATRALYRDVCARAGKEL